jgi:tetraacyldisaccharide 4'-kinase
MSISSILKIISGERTGIFASIIRFGLRCFTPFYRFAIWSRNRQFDSGSRKIKSVDAKVISIGNITTGGTGKTPMVVWVCQLLQQHQTKVGIVSRGYGAEQTGVQNDEAMELESRLPGVPHEQDPDRVAAAKRCVKKHSVDAIVLDDGFQHRRLGRDLDIVLIDATNPFGYDHLIPRGLLREPVSSLKRCDAVVVTRCNRVDSDRVEEIRNRIQRETSSPIALSRTRAVALIQHDGQQVALSEAHAGRWFAFSAIGNPGSFENSLRELGFELAGSQRFRDHHSFTKAELLEMVLAATASEADRLVCTHKDLVKVGSKAIEGLPVYALKIELEVFEGREALERLIREIVDDGAIVKPNTVQ